MADWIKMRSSLLTNPKVIRMARVLLAEREFLDVALPWLRHPVTRDESRHETSHSGRHARCRWCAF
jgi:hypothetical protein